MTAVDAVPDPPITITFCAWAGGSRTLAPWSRVSALIAALLSIHATWLVPTFQRNGSVPVPSSNAWFPE